MSLRKPSTPYLIVNAILLVAFAAACLLPFYYVLTVSFSDPMAVKQGEVRLLPKGFSVKPYQMIFRQVTFFNAFKVTVLRTVFGTAFGVAVQTAMAYALARRSLKGRKFFMLMVVFTVLFNGGMIPTYLVVRYTGLLDSLLALIIPQAANALNVIILTTFFMSIPPSIEESARMDGAHDLTIFARLVLPLSLPAVATISLFVAVFHWNALMDGVLYINKSHLKPMQVFLMDMILMSNVVDLWETSEEHQVPVLSIQTAAIFAATVPILLFYPFIQKHFMKGIMLGALKG